MQQIAFQTCIPAEESMRKGFSLLELLLVIFIISMVYFLGFDGFEKPKPSADLLTPKNLKSVLSKSDLFTQAGTFLCTDRCSSCYYKGSSDKTFKPYEGKTALKGSEVYFFNAEAQMQKMDYGRFHDRKICLLMQFYPNGSATQVILKQGNHIYLLPSYLGKPRTFSSLDEAKDFLVKNTERLSRNGDFY